MSLGQEEQAMGIYSVQNFQEITVAHLPSPIKSSQICSFNQQKKSNNLLGLCDMKYVEKSRECYCLNGTKSSGSHFSTNGIFLAEE